MPEAAVQKQVNPEGGRASLDAFVIHVMPKEFLGKSVSSAILQKPAPSPQAKPATPVIVPAAPAPAQPPKPLTPSAPVAKPRKSKTLPILLVLAILLFSGMGIWAYLTLITEPVPAPVIPEPEPEPEPIPEPEPEPIIPQNSLDTDSDGLTDKEEVLFKTDFRNPDTDADSYLDGNEVFHGYDPLSFAPASLLDSGSVAVFRVDDPLYGYSLIHPVGWSAAVSAPQGGVQGSVISVNGTERITITPTLLETSGEDAGQRISQDGLTTTITYGDVKYEIAYRTEGALAIDYLQTYKMMVNSFIRLE